MVNGESEDPFVQYYAEESLTAKAVERSEGVLGAVMRARSAAGVRTEALEVADVGCNAGTQSLVWARRGHKVYGLDINADLIAIAIQRARDAGIVIDFRVGTATELPWRTGSVDVCLLPELLEHVPDWETCLNEACRVLKPGGALHVSTTNRLCPVQQEFDLPLYSWYPAALKRYCERLSVTTRPQWVSHAKYPAVNWFTPYELRDWFAQRGFTFSDRFDLMDISAKGQLARTIVALIRAIPILRWAGHLATPGTFIVGIKTSAHGRP